jgi:hypothetical protein
VFERAITFRAWEFVPRAGDQKRIFVFKKKNRKKRKTIQRGEKERVEKRASRCDLCGVQVDWDSRNSGMAVQKCGKYL